MKAEKMKQLAATVLASRTMKEAAAKSGISERTLRRIRKEPDFLAALDEVRASALESMVNVVCDNAAAGAGQLVSIMNDSTAPASSRVSAARAILDTAKAYHDQVEIYDRITALEQHFERMTDDEQ